MIKKVSGDILLSEAQAIAHGIAPHDHFNQGLALALRTNFPAMAKDFRHYCHQYNPKSGHAWLWAGADGVIINLMTQESAADEKSNPGKATVKSVSHALKELRKIVEDNAITSIALPRLASGVGGMEWSEVEPLIQEYLADLPIPVIIYETFVSGKKAAENIAKAA